MRGRGIISLFSLPGNTVEGCNKMRRGLNTPRRTLSNVWLRWKKCHALKSKMSSRRNFIFRRRALCSAALAASRAGIRLVWVANCEPINWYAGSFPFGEGNNLQSRRASHDCERKAYLTSEREMHRRLPARLLSHARLRAKRARIGLSILNCKGDLQPNGITVTL